MQDAGGLRLGQGSMHVSPELSRLQSLTCLHMANPGDCLSTLCHLSSLQELKLSCMHDTCRVPAHLGGLCGSPVRLHLEYGVLGGKLAALSSLTCLVCKDVSLEGRFPLNFISAFALHTCGASIFVFEDLVMHAWSLMLSPSSQFTATPSTLPR